MNAEIDIEQIFQRNVPGSRGILSQKTVAVAGCGGLGSNAAVALTRAGVGKLIIADFDRVELSNLNRQYFFIDDVGKKKTEALKAHLLRINPSLQIQDHFLKLDKNSTPDIFKEADLLVEAFDRAESKAWLVESWCIAYPDRFIVAASGISGCGGTESIVVRRSGKIVMCGDFETDMSMGLCAPRVSMAANMQANLAIQLLLTN